MRRATHLCTLVALSACAPENLGGYSGEDLHDMFPFDEIRHWTYQTADTTVAWRLIADQLPESEVVGTTRVFTIEVKTDCFHPDDACTENGLVDTWKMSSTASDGVLVYEMGGTVYDPPVLLADNPQLFEQGKTTVSGGVTFTATYAARETCPAEKYWPAGPPECVRIDLTDGDAGTTVAGSYWAVGNFGLVAYQHTSDGILWGLKDFSAEQF